MKRSFLLLLAGFAVGYLTSYGIHRSPIGEKAEAVLSRLSPGKLWNWCPSGVTRVVLIESSKEITQVENLREVCGARLTRTLPVDTKGNFKALLKAQNKDGQVSFLEYDRSLKLFRIESQVFESESYRQALSQNEVLSDSN